MAFQFLVILRNRELRKLFCYLLGWLKKNSSIRFLKHTQVIIGISHRQHTKVQAFQSDYRFPFLIILTQYVVFDPVRLVVYLKGMAKQCWIPKLRNKVHVNIA